MPKPKLLLIILTPSLPLIFFATTAFSATLKVPSQYSTIQSAINAASSGDTILVSAGTYTENITLDADDANETLQSVSGASVTTINGNDSGSVITINGATNSTVDGFTITNGNGTQIGPTKSGGGVLINNDSVTVQNCIIHSNDVTGKGGGICIFNGATITISNCTIYSNTSSSHGAGIAISSTTGVSRSISNCTIYSNTSSTSGGGISNESDTLTVSKCKIYSNTATGDSNGNGGGGIFSKDCSTTVTNCLIYSNTVTDSSGYGAGIDFINTTATTTPSVTNCTIVSNTGAGNLGAGICLANRSNATIKNTIIASNTKYGVYETGTASSPAITNCDLYGNGNLYYDTVSAELTTIAQVNALTGCSGNIASDSLFISSSSNNYRLQSTTLGYSANSPCIDAGNSSGAPSTDLEGNTRPRGTTYDIGCYEADATGTLLATLNKDANKEKASVGDVVTYTLTIKNTSSQSMVNTNISDTLPQGFKYLTNSAKLNNSSISNPTGGRTKTFSLGTLSSGTTYTLKYKAVIGSGVGYGKSINTAYLVASAALSSTAQETVLIVPNPIFNAATIIGKVYQDLNKNGYPDENEPGLEDIALLTEDGFMVITDEYGRYHLDGLKPQTKVIALDTKTLPKGAKLTTENPVLLRLTPALMMKANFGVYVEEEKK